MSKGAQYLAGEMAVRDLVCRRVDPLSAKFRFHADCPIFSPKMSPLTSGARARFGQSALRETTVKEPFLNLLPGTGGYKDNMNKLKHPLSHRSGVKLSRKSKGILITGLSQRLRSPWKLIFHPMDPFALA